MVELASPLGVYAEADSKVEEQEGSIEEKARKYGILDYVSSAKLAESGKPEFIIEGVMVAGQPMVIGGREKTLKTSIAVDLAVSVATGTPFLGRFEVKKTGPVLFYSVESDQQNINGILERVCAARGLSALPDGITWVFHPLPLADEKIEQMLALPIKQKNALVLIVDPLYLQLQHGGEEADPRNLYAVGGRLARLSRSSIEQNCIPIVLHHSNSKLETGRTMQLNNLQYAGVQQWCGQWILLNRHKEFRHDGRHELTMAIGIRGVCSSRWNLRVDEGLVNDQLTAWDTEVIAVGGQPDDTRRIRRNADKVKQAIRSLPSDLNGWVGREAAKSEARLSGSDMNAAVEYLKSRTPPEIEILENRPRRVRLLPVAQTQSVFG